MNLDDLLTTVAASSFGNCPRVLMILRNCAWTLSSAWVVYIRRRTSGGKAKNGMIEVEARRHDATALGNLRPPRPRAKSSSAALAASAFAAV